MGNGTEKSNISIKNFSFGVFSLMCVYVIIPSFVICVCQTYKQGYLNELVVKDSYNP